MLNAVGCFSVFEAEPSHTALSATAPIRLLLLMALAVPSLTAAYRHCSTGAWSCQV